MRSLRHKFFVDATIGHLLTSMLAFVLAIWMLLELAAIKAIEIQINETISYFTSFSSAHHFLGLLHDRNLFGLDDQPIVGLGRYSWGQDSS